MIKKISDKDKEDWKRFIESDEKLKNQDIDINKIAEWPKKRSIDLHGYTLEKANRASELMETGTVAVNTPLVAIAEAPFGGIKQTGYGREGGSMAIKDYLNVKYTHLGIKG